MLARLVVATALTLIGRSVHTTAWNEDLFDVQYIAKLFHEDDMTAEFTEQLGSHDHTSDVTTRRDIDKGDKYGPSQNEAKTLARRAAEKVMHHVLTRSALKVMPPWLLQKANNASGDSKKAPRNINHEDVDIVDREDHVTQYLSDQMVNTDSEITCLQASESEDESGSGSGSNESDASFALSKILVYSCILLNSKLPQHSWEKARQMMEDRRMLMMQEYVVVVPRVKADKFFDFLTGLEEAVEVDGAWSRPNTDDYMKLPMSGHKKDNAITDDKYKD